MKRSADNAEIRRRKRIRREVPPKGTKLVGRSRGRVYEAIIVESSTKPKRCVVRVQGREFLSLSGAARAVTGTSTNGWVFWKIKGES